MRCPRCKEDHSGMESDIQQYLSWRVITRRKQELEARTAELMFVFTGSRALRVYIALISGARGHKALTAAMHMGCQCNGDYVGCNALTTQIKDDIILMARNMATDPELRSDPRFAVCCKRPIKSQGMEELSKNHSQLGYQYCLANMQVAMCKHDCGKQLFLFESFLVSEDGLRLSGLDQIKPVVELFNSLQRGLKIALRNPSCCRECWKQTDKKYPLRCRCCRQFYFCSWQCMARTKNHGSFECAFYCNHRDHPSKAVSERTMLIL